MRGRKFLKEWLPPAAIKIALYLKAKLFYADWEKVNSGWDYPTNTAGWNESSIVDLQVKKWDAFLKAIKSPNELYVNHESNDYSHEDVLTHNLLISYSYVCALAADGIRNLRLLDWGGGLGHYGKIAEEMLVDKTVKYSCFDLPVFSDAISKYYPACTFFSEKQALENERFDLVNVSSSLWYDKDWKATLSFLTDKTERYIYVTRMIFVKKMPGFVAVQRPSSMGYKTSYLCIILNENELLDYCESIKLKLVRKFYLGTAPTIYGSDEQGALRGYLFAK